jgi:peptidoglycan/xylan/chitin deacetylase (PgdA/CDA1 family)
VKRLVKRTLEAAVGRVAPQTWRFGSAPRLLVLTYHRVLPADHEDRGIEQPGMYVSPETFGMHLRELKQYFELVHLDDWLAKAAKGEALPRLACAITFDDGWRDNYLHAFPTLQKEQAPAMIFLVSEMTGSGSSFWPNRLGRLLSRACRAHSLESVPQELRNLLGNSLDAAVARGEAKQADIDAAIVRAKSLDDRTMKRLLDVAEASLPPDARNRHLLDWQEVQQMAHSGLVRFGSHSRTHQRMSADLAPEELEREIGLSREEIREHTGQPVDVFCYPNGDTSAAALEVVKRHYFGAVTTARGWHEPSADRWLVRRISMHDDVSRRPDAFLARVSTWL